jgi:hypothetical protein
MRVVLLDAFFVMVAAVAGWKLIRTARIGTATYQGKPFARSETPTAFWFITALNVALVLGALYGIAVGLSL